MNKIISSIYAPLAKAKAEVESFAYNYRTRKSFQNSDRSLVDENSLVDVSLTSHGYRLKQVHLAIESIGQGLLRPRTLTLWVDDAEFYRNLPVNIRRLVARGLAVKFSKNFGPHTKYYPQLLQGSIQFPVATADDDILYPKSWLQDLFSAYKQRHETIACHRAHKFSFNGHEVSPYRDWRRCKDRNASILNFMTGVSGVIYPPRFLETVKARGDAFLGCCPKNDDVWLHSNAVRANFPISQIGPSPRHFPHVDGSQTEALNHQNLLNNANDQQIRETYSADDIRLLLAAWKKDQIG